MTSIVFSLFNSLKVCNRERQNGKGGVSELKKGKTFIDYLHTPLGNSEFIR